ncbi:MAG: YfhO family protein [Anaerolineae bacterium]
MQETRNRHWSLFIVYCSFILFPLLLLWRPLFAGEAFYWGTPLLQFIPWQRLAAEMWRSGHLPLWNPLVGCGAPLAANYQTAAFYPLNVLYLLLPAEVALTWTTVLHLALTGWGMYRWGRAVGLDCFAALVGALALEGSGFLVARAALFPSMALTFPWVGVWLWCGEVLVQRGRLGDVLWLGLVLGLGLLAGHAQTAFYSGVLLLAYLVFRTVQTATGEMRNARSKRQDAGDHASRVTHHALCFVLHTFRLLAPAALSLALGVGLAAVQLLPTAELMLQSQRATGVDYDFAMTNSMWPWRLITFFAPDFFGNPGRGNYWENALTYWEDAGYVGVLPLLLAVGAILALLRRGSDVQWRGATVFWLLLTGGSLLLALGQNTPVFPFLFRHVPTFDVFQAPARWLAVTMVALAGLAAIGAQCWPAGHLGKRRGALSVVIGLALLIGGLVASYVVPGIPPTFGPATALLGGLLAVAGSLLLLRRDVAWWRIVTIAFVLLDLLFFGWPLVPTVDRSLYRGSTQVAIFLKETGAARVYWPTDPTHRNREYDAENRVKFNYLRFSDFGSHDVGDWWGMREALIPNIGMLDGVASANNFDPLLVGRYADLLSIAKSSQVLRAMGVTHVMSDEPWLDAEPVYTTESATLHRLPETLGRAWIVPNDRKVLSSEIPALLSDPDFDPAFEVLLEQESLSGRHLPTRPFAPSQILSLHDGPNRITIHAALDEPAYLVLADTWYPGWLATVDGESVEILRANYGFRAVWLGAGEHTVEMIYRPTSVLVGGTLSITALVVIVVGLLLARRREMAA